VYERVHTDQKSRGAGIVTHAELFAALEMAGVVFEPSTGQKVRLRRMFDRAGRIIHEITFPQITTSWATVYALLKDRFGDSGHFLGKEFVRAERNGDRAIAHFSDGTTAQGDLIVGADGLRSTVRGQFLPEVVPLYAGYITWRGVVPEGMLSEETRNTVFDHFCFCLPEHEQMAGYPISSRASAENGGSSRRGFNFVWYRPADQAQLERFLTDADGRLHPLGIPPPLVRKNYIVAMRDDAVSKLAPQFAEIIMKTEHPFFQPIYDLTVPRMIEGRMALIGDAAFVARPHIGAGVTKALEDATALAQALTDDDDIDAALARFSKARQPIGSLIVNKARQLGAYLQASRTTEMEHACARRYREAEPVLRDTASVAFFAR
jgi:2-polyprenyl-6-methoxyphenol hydroxylase-like FAD-dependent oxidoreductase